MTEEQLSNARRGMPELLRRQILGKFPWETWLGYLQTALRTHMGDTTRVELGEPVNYGIRILIVVVDSPLYADTNRLAECELKALQSASKNDMEMIGRFYINYLPRRSMAIRENEMVAKPASRVEETKQPVPLTEVITAYKNAVDKHRTGLYEIEERIREEINEIKVAYAGIPDSYRSLVVDPRSLFDGLYRDLEKLLNGKSLY